MTSIVATGFAKAPIETVWGILADARNYHSWAAPARTKLDREGSPTPDGVGAIRNFGTGPITSREEVVAFEPPTHLGYILLSGLPVVGYRADVELRSENGGTAITWRSTYEPAKAWLTVPMRAFLTVVLKDFVKRLSRASAKAAGVPDAPP
jgi:uncharacterized protein YndB with AHSA1/START domain